MVLDEYDPGLGLRSSLEKLKASKEATQDKSSLIGSYTFDDLGPEKFYPWFRMTENEKLRVGLVFRDGNEFLATKVHYHKRMGYFLCKGKTCCRKLGRPKWRVGVAVVVYPSIINADNHTPCDDIRCWFFNERVFAKLKEINKEFSLGEHDIGIRCINKKYQHLEIVPLQKSIWQGTPSLYEVLDEIPRVYGFIEKSIARDFPEDQIQEILSEDPELKKKEKTHIAPRAAEKPRQRRVQWE